jgi:hypothetical protein
MSDISKCPGIGCDKKDKCYRYTSEGSTFQSYFQPEVKDCEYFINNEEIDKTKETECT